MSDEDLHIIQDLLRYFRQEWKEKFENDFRTMVLRIVKMNIGKSDTMNSYRRAVFQEIKMFAIERLEKEAINLDTYIEVNSRAKR